MKKPTVFSLHPSLIMSLVLSFLLSNSSYSQDLGPKKLLDSSCDYHDFNRELMNNAHRFVIEESRPGKSIRLCTLEYNPPKESFSIEYNIDGNKIQYRIKKNKTEIKFNGSNNFTDEEKQNYNLTRERALLLKDYYYYIWYLPVKLFDPGTSLSASLTKTSFNNIQCLELAVTYPQQDESDTWRFFFSPKNHKLMGYLFFNSRSDGEYIFLSDEITYEGLRIPAKREWYDNHNDTFLGSDKLLSIERI